MISRMNHVAIAVNDLPNTLRFYEEAFGLKAGPILTVPSQGVRVASIVFMNTKIEFISPLSPSSPISKFLKERGDGLHHITLETTTLQRDLREIKERGIRTLSDSPTLGYDGKPIIFLHPKDTHGVLIELEETKPD